jgi:hypothetical protein
MANIKLRKQYSVKYQVVEMETECHVDKIGYVGDIMDGLAKEQLEKMVALTDSMLPPKPQYQQSSKPNSFQNNDSDPLQQAISELIKRNKDGKAKYGDYLGYVDPKKLKSMADVEALRKTMDDKEATLNGGTQPMNPPINDTIDASGW